ncbi:acyl-CoA dehydrogenase family protein [Streptomyces antibioticus]|uniref:Acyl-CoA dehydrogenase n=1 Tax=Streptomyces antibioticus TaxID=1890 RepID=A0AAE6Y4G4_STRAT|nr:acyl-CoA dehydrogenase family protein [Streptomyces antibioticus]OOQ55017.1 acyl-CoA dehydrogenase [Streptomyces antibioticus]QIT42661.1 acyl-CoA/acyl-ACP dehydrogenase [Streptomyces antibioticus]
MTAATAPHPLVTRARRLADDLLAPHAEEVDRTRVPESHLREIRRSGLLGLNAPVAYGGTAVPAAVFRETAEILAGACCSTWFVQTQHHTPVQTVAGSDGPVRERLLHRLASGELLSGVAYAHLRAAPRRPVRVTRDGTGWRFDGTVPWYTGWGLNDVLLLAGVTDEDEALFAVTEARDQPGLRASAPMRLAALTAARTVSLELDGLRLPEEAVALHTPLARWAAADRLKTVNANPAVFGVAEAALGLVDDDRAAALRDRLARVRGDAYALADEAAPDEHLADRLALRTQAYEVLQAATTAAVVTGGGRTMLLSHRAQRLAREALFLMVQGQTRESRRSHLDALVP